jgi:hypothetical protein
MLLPVKRVITRRKIEFATVVVLVLAASCASTPLPEPHAGVAKRWGQFLSMPRQRAFALAGDPDGVWVGATVGGYMSPAEAERAALKECEERRAAREIPTECRIYASGRSIVWDSAAASGAGAH